jgi:hypothetical protein
VGAVVLDRDAVPDVVGAEEQDDGVRVARDDVVVHAAEEARAGVAVDPGVDDDAAVGFGPFA